MEAEPDKPLLWVLREDLGLTGTKFGCGQALCGACTLHVDGEAVRACAFPIRFAEGKSITTIEDLESDPLGRAVVDAWIEKDVVQCGWCQPGQCMSAAALLKEVRQPDDAAIGGTAMAAGASSITSGAGSSTESGRYRGWVGEVRRRDQTARNTRGCRHRNRGHARRARNDG